MSRTRENMMRFRLHTTIAVLGAILLLPSLALTQEMPAAPGQDKPAAQQQQAEPESSVQEAPIEPVLSGPYPVMSKAAEDRGRQIFQMFNHTQTTEMWASLSDGLRRHSGKEERFVEVNKKLREKMGLETQMLAETIVPYIMAPDTVYSRLSNFANARVPIIVEITINQRGQIDGFTIRPEPTVAEGRYAGYQDTNKLKLPFADEWLVYFGGRTPFENVYALSDDQRFGFDFVYLKNDRMFSGKGGVGSKNEDYYCFGQNILAPADGTIIKAEGLYDDNPPGKPSGDPGDGNTVVISHGSGESSVFNHLKQNSVKVKVGDKVKQGDVIGQCGNSGAGPIPYVHYQLRKTAGVPLPVQFVDYVADGKPVASGEPKKGQFVKNAASASAANPTAPAAKDKPAPATASTTPSKTPTK